MDASWGDRLKFYVAVALYRLDLSHAMSLKDKRQVVRSLLDRIGRSRTLSAAEVGENDSWKTALIAVTCASRSMDQARKSVEGSLGLIERDAEVSDRKVWVFSSEDLEEA